MAVDCQNIYKNARKSAGFTQEKAAQLLSVSVDSLRDYEQSQRPVPSDVASAMCDVYQAPYLAVQHLRLSSELGKRVVPEIELKDLPEAVIGVLAAVQKFIIKRDAMIEIVADGKIEEDEQAEWNEIMDRMNNLFVAIPAIRSKGYGPQGHSFGASRRGMESGFAAIWCISISEIIGQNRNFTAVESGGRTERPSSSGNATGAKKLSISCASARSCPRCCWPPLVRISRTRWHPTLTNLRVMFGKC